MCNLKYPHEEEIIALKAEIERLRNVIEESNRSTQMYRRRLDDLDRQYSKYKNEWYKADHEQRAEIERLREECKDVEWLREEHQKLIRENTRRGQIMVFCRARAAAWKRCAKRWHSGLQWLADCNGFFDENEFSIMKKNCEFVNIAKAPPDWREKWIPSSPEDKSALDKKPGSTEP